MARRCFVLATSDPDPVALRRQVRDDDIVLPLSLRSLSSLKGKEKGVVCVEELVPYTTLKSTQEAAFRLTKRFAEVACSGELLDGLDWPEICRDDQRLRCFRDLLFADVLSKAMVEHGVGEVVWCGDDRAPSHLPDHVILETLRANEAYALRVQRPANSRDRVLGKVADGISSRLRRVRSGLSRSTRSKSSRASLVSIFSLSEWERFTDSLVELHASFPGEYCYWCFGSAGRALERWATSNDITIKEVPYPRAVEEDVGMFFSTRWARWQDAVRHHLADEFRCPALSDERLSNHFRVLFSYTMPHAAQWARTLRKELTQRQPELVVGSAASTYGTFIPYHVTRAMGIPSVALPVSSAPGGHDTVPGTYLACNNLYQRESHRYYVPDDERVLLCRNASNKLSYRDSGLESGCARGIPLVVVLTCLPMFEYEVGLPLAHTGEFLDTLRALASPPSGLNDLEFAIKAHPRFDTAPLMNDCPLGPNVRLVPATSSVTNLLAGAWAVVVCNHYGGVVAEAVAAGKPLLFLDSAGYHFTHLVRNGDAAGIVVPNLELFWLSLRRLRDSPEYYRQLSRRCGDVKARYQAEPVDDLPAGLGRIWSSCVTAS